MSIGIKDIRFAIKGAKFKSFEKTSATKKILAPDFWKASMARARPTDVACHFIDTKTSYSYADVEKYSNQVAHYCISVGLKAGDTVALYLDNSVEYFMIWLGISKMGGRTALINFNLKHRGLAHSLNVSAPRICIFGKEFEGALQEVLQDVTAADVKWLCFGGESALGDEFEKGLREQPTTPLPLEQTAAKQGVTIKDPVLYIYTSGTTGQPKAAIITHHRFALASYVFTLMFDVGKRDRVYICLPLYHSAAGMIGTGMLIHGNATLYLRKKFSASKFIGDVREHRCTITQYIGEICRYILATPVSPDDKDNHLRLALGNGLRPDIWQEFQERFAIAKIGEFYAATEGASALINTEGKFGALGFVSPLIRAIVPVLLARVDPETNELLRGPNGKCIECGPDEPGEFLAKIYTVKKVQNFQGYTNAEDSKKKVAENVKKTGDAWFRSGDLLKMDRQGFIYFVDRIGDTFRWKGENCSTAEIAETISTFIKKGEVNVYGVLVSGKEGRGGMAAITGLAPSDTNMEELVAYLQKHLPAYAIPLFLRFLPEMELTGTYKQKKGELRDQGFDLTTVTDPLYFLEGKTYVPLTQEISDKIIAGQVRL